MQAALRVQTTILPGHRLEIAAPELPEGATVEVLVVWSAEPSPRRQSMLDFLAPLPPGPLLFPTPEEANQSIQHGSVDAAGFGEQATAPRRRW